MKIKNAKLFCWHIQLSQFEYDIAYRAEKFNAAEDRMSRIYCANSNFLSLHEINAGLCHPGITRTYRFIKMKNFPYSIDEVRSNGQCEKYNDVVRTTGVFWIG